MFYLKNKKKILELSKNISSYLELWVYAFVSFVFKVVIIKSFSANLDLSLVLVCHERT